MTSTEKSPDRRLARIAVLLACLLAVAAALAGCTGSAKSGKSSSSDTGSGAVMDAAAGGVTVRGAAAPQPQSAPLPQNAPVSTPATDNRSVVRTASVDLRTPDVDAVATRIDQLAAANGGRVESDQRADSDKQRRATVSLRVRPDRLDQVVAAVVALGHATSRQIQDDDVTTTRADVTARVAALATSVSRLRQLLARSGTVSDLVLLEKTLSSRESDLEAMRARETAISEQVALASLTVNLSAPAAVLPAAKAGGIHPTGFFAAIGRGFHAVVIGVGLALAGLGYVLPAAVPLAVIVLALLGWRRRRSARGRTTGTAPTPA